MAVRNVTNEDNLETGNITGSAQTNMAGQLYFQPGGNFGNSDSERDYQRPREYLVTVGVNW